MAKTISRILLCDDEAPGREMGETALEILERSYKTVKTPAEVKQELSTSRFDGLLIDLQSLEHPGTFSRNMYDSIEDIRDLYPSLTILGYSGLISHYGKEVEGHVDGTFCRSAFLPIDGIGFNKEGYQELNRILEEHGL